MRKEGEASLVAEITSDARNRPIAIRAARYEVIRRDHDHLLTGTFQVAAMNSVAVKESEMSRIEYGRAVRKGGTAAREATAVYAEGGFRGPLLGMGAAPTGGVGTRTDLRSLSLTLAMDFGAASFDAARGARLDTSELGLRAGIYRPFDLGRLTAAPGAEIGGSRFSQSATDGSVSRHSYAGSVGPSLILEISIYRRAYVGFQAALPIYLIDAQSADGGAGDHTFHATYRMTATAGAFL